jgi:hypothetical protein
MGQYRKNKENRAKTERCQVCYYYYKGACCHYPEIFQKKEDDWCGQFKAWA